MKNKLTIICIIAIFIIIAGFILPANASDNKKGVISVNTTADKTVAPDVVEVTFAVKTSDVESMQKATLLNKEVSDIVFSQLKSMINTENGDYIKTADFTANPVYSYQNSKKIFEKYEVSNKVIVHTKNIDKVGEMIDKAIVKGATNVDNLSFSLSDYESYCNDLISIATQKAKTRAGVIAQALSNTISGLNEINSSCSTNNYNSPRFYMAKNAISDSAVESVGGTSTPISKGEIKISASVNASFFVK